MRHSENAPLRATQAGNLRVGHRRIGRRRLPADSACPRRATIRIRFGLVTAPFRGSVRHFYTTSQGIPGRFLDASDTSTCGGVALGSGWLRRGRELHGMSLHRRMLIGNPNA
jgi:hypothetical protein